MVRFPNNSQFIRPVFMTIGSTLNSVAEDNLKIPQRYKNSTA